MKRRFYLCFLPVCLTFVWSTVAHADQASGDFKCDKAVVRVASPTKIILVCPSRWPMVTPAVEIWKFQNRNDPRQAPTNMTGSTRGAVSAAEQQFVLAIDVDPSYPLQGGQKYVIAIAPAATPAQIAFYDLLTDPKASISNSLAAAERGSRFAVDSPVGLVSDASATFYEKREKASPQIVHPDAHFNISAQNPGCTPDDADCIGRASVKLEKKLRQAKAIIGVNQLTDVFGQAVSAEGSVDISTPPKGKDDASQYYQFNHLGARGSKPSVSINVKANSLPGFVSSFWIGSFLAQPDIAVDVGTTDFAKKTEDSIKLGLITSKTSLSSFGQIIFGPGIAYETNWGFKKNNLIGNFDSRFIPNGWYKTREIRRLNAAAADQKLSLDDIPLSKFKWGRGLEFFLGAEAGGSLRDQTFSNKAKTTSIPVPRYSIFRFRPKLHGFIEYDRVTLDWSGTLRVLGPTELVGEEQPDKTLNLRRVHGARGLMETTLSFGLDESKHLNLAITYKRGSQPPSFKHFESVLTGLVLKY